jgi:hypothetical protein
MSYWEGSNYQAKREDEGKPLFDSTPEQKAMNKYINDWLNEPRAEAIKQIEAIRKKVAIGFYEWMKKEDHYRRYDIEKLYDMYIKTLYK